MNFLSYDDWTAIANTHQSLVSPWGNAYIKRREVGLKHPVHDFLFEYYPFSPAKLKHWVPAINEVLEIDGELGSFPWLYDKWFLHENNTLKLNQKRIAPQTLSLVAFVEKLCDAILQKIPRFGCFGLHEWAMVYRLSTEAIRHNGCRLRLSPEKIAEFIESQNLCCSHYDAYRFFTPQAQPLNMLQPTLEARIQNEQGGCLHANMDVYKWSTKLWPWIGSTFIAKAFFLALEGRELDMRASPYDLKEHGFEPICIELEEGRKEYQILQQNYALKATEMRKELLAFCKRLLLWSTQD